LSQLQTKRVALLAPTLDYISEELLYFSLPPGLIVSSSPVVSIDMMVNNSWVSYSVGEVIPYYTLPSSNQHIRFRVALETGDTIQQQIIISTPELIIRDRAYFDCGLEYFFKDSNGNKTKFCVSYGCSDNENNTTIIDKPFILVTGYRPPIFGQSYKKTWETYSTFHNGFLENLVNSDFDVILVR